MYIKPITLNFHYNNVLYQGIASVPRFSQHPFSNRIPTVYNVSLNNVFMGIFTVVGGVWECSLDTEEEFIKAIGNVITKSVHQTMKEDTSVQFY